MIQMEKVFNCFKGKECGFVEQNTEDCQLNCCCSIYHQRQIWQQTGSYGQPLKGAARSSATNSKQWKVKNTFLVIVEEHF